MAAPANVHQQHRPPPVAVAQHAQHRRKQELHRRIERQHDADDHRHLAGMRYVLQQSRQNREDQPDADRVERHSGEDDDQCLVQLGALQPVDTRGAFYIRSRLALQTKCPALSGKAAVSLKRDRIRSRW